jgi:hypothetical protein
LEFFIVICLVSEYFRINKAALEVNIEPNIPSATSTTEKRPKEIASEILARFPWEVSCSRTFARVRVLVKFPSGAIITVLFLWPLLEVGFHE